MTVTDIKYVYVQNYDQFCNLPHFTLEKLSTVADDWKEIVFDIDILYELLFTRKGLLMPTSHRVYQCGIQLETINKLGIEEIASEIIEYYAGDRSSEYKIVIAVYPERTLFKGEQDFSISVNLKEIISGDLLSAYEDRMYGKLVTTNEVHDHYHRIIKLNDLHEKVKIDYSFFPQNLYGSILANYSLIHKSETLFIDAGLISYISGCATFDKEFLDGYVRRIIKGLVDIERVDETLNNVVVYMGYIDIVTAMHTKKRGWKEFRSLQQLLEKTYITVDHLKEYVRDTRCEYSDHALTYYRQALLNHLQ